MKKSDGVEDIVSWMKEQIKEQKKAVDEAKKYVRAFGCYEDCGDSYRSDLAAEEAKLNVMVAWKISTEKYMKKLRHEGN